MNSDTKEIVKIALLAVIAITLTYDTFLSDDGADRPRDRRAAFNQAPPPPSNAAANPTPNDIAATFDQNNGFNPQQPPQPAVPTGPSTSMAFAEMQHSFGNIKQDTENKHIFTFTNTGAEPLVISDAKGSCGCTVPKFPREPIAPGSTGEIEVVYKPGKQKGKQTKTVTITANTDPVTTRLEISAEVEEVGGGDAS